MWFNEQTAGKLGLPLLPRPRWDYEEWAHTQLPQPENYYKHPFCSSLESALIKTISRSLAYLDGLGNVKTKRYAWRNGQIGLKEDPVKTLLYLNHPQGHAFIGSYRHEPFAYTFPCIGLVSSRIEGEFIPIFLRDHNLVEELDYDTSQSMFFRNRPLTDLPQDVIKSLDNRLHPRRFW
jgi:hypothetical protein